MKTTKRRNDDAMAPLRLCLKILCAWPENQSQLQRYISYLNYPVYSLVTIPFMVWFIVVDAPSQGPVSLLRGVSDTIGLATFVVRGTLIIYLAKNVYKLSILTTNGCKPYEENHKVVHIRPSRLVWCPNIFFLIQIILSMISCTSGLWASVEERQMSVPVCKTALRTNFIYFPLVINFTVGHIPVWLTVTASDALIVSLSTTIREKAETMKNILRDLDKVQGHSEQDAELSNIIKYHNVIATVRIETERIISYAMLLQLLFLVVSLGSPGIRLLYVRDSMSMEDFGFTVFYVLWVVSQLIVYCEMGEAATHACTSLGFAAYSAYHPDMAPAAARKIVLIMARAQRPMDLTARKLIKINRKTLLKICRRSYSLYSTILNVK